MFKKHSIITLALMPVFAHCATVETDVNESHSRLKTAVKIAAVVIVAGAMCYTRYKLHEDFKKKVDDILADDRLSKEEVPSAVHCVLRDYEQQAKIYGSQISLFM